MVLIEGAWGQGSTMTMNACLWCCCWFCSYHQDSGYGSEPTSSFGGDQVHHAVCSWLLWGVQWCWYAADDRPSWTTTGNGCVFLHQLVLGRYRVVEWLLKCNCISMEANLWLFIQCSAFVFPPSSTLQRLQWSWQRSKTKTSTWNLWTEWKSLRAGHTNMTCFLVSRAFLWALLCEIAVFFSLPAYTVTWWSIWMLRLFSKRSVTSTWRWTGYVPHSFTSEPSRTPHITVRAQSRDRSQQLSGLFVK